MFKITADRSSRTIRFAILGLWDEQTMKDFGKELARCAREFPDDGRPFYAIADLLDCPTQTQHTATEIQSIMDGGKGRGMEHVALVVRSALTKMQFARLSRSDLFAFFSTMEEAEAWLALKQKTANEAGPPA